MLIFAAFWLTLSIFISENIGYSCKLAICDLANIHDAASVGVADVGAGVGVGVRVGVSTCVGAGVGAGAGVGTGVDAEGDSIVASGVVASDVGAAVGTQRLAISSISSNSIGIHVCIHNHMA